MTNTNGGERLDRIEAALLKFIEKSGNRIDSNAKSLEALTNQSAENENRISQDRSRLYEMMAQVASAQADTYRKLQSQDDLMQTLSRRQGEIVAILKALTPKEENGGQ